jgi:hypothetical protein
VKIILAIQESQGAQSQVLRPVWRLGNQTKRENLLEVAITKFTPFPTVEKMSPTL